MSAIRFGVRPLLVGIVAANAAADPFPFVEDLRYEYEYVIQMVSESYRSYFSGMAVVGGAAVRVQRVEGGANDGAQHFWSETEDADKLYHGSQHRSESEPYLFIPPVMTLDSPLFVGKTWSVDTQTSDGLSVHFDFEVIAFGDVAVPAGVFQAFTVLETAQFPKSKTDAALTRFTGVPGIVGGVTHATRSYADGVGPVLSVLGNGGRTDRLLAVHTVGVEQTTWTRIRGFYR